MNPASQSAVTLIALNLYLNLYIDTQLKYNLKLSFKQRNGCLFCHFEYSAGLQFNGYFMYHLTHNNTISDSKCFHLKRFCANLAASLFLFILSYYRRNYFCTKTPTSGMS